MKKDKRPVIEIQPTQFDMVVEGLAIAALMLLVGLAAYYYGKLPDEIPKHFNVHGEPDAYGSKSIIWILTGVGAFVYLLLTLVNKSPENFNYPHKITVENAEASYRNAMRMMRSLKAGILLLFAYIIYQMIQVGMGKSAGMGYGFWLILIVTVFGPIVVFGLWPVKKKLS